MKTLLWHFYSCWISQKVWDLNLWVLDRWLPLHKSAALWVRWFLQQPLLEIAPSGSCLNTNQAWNLKSSWFASLGFDLHSQPLPFIITRHIFWLHHKESSNGFSHHLMSAKYLRWISFASLQNCLAFFLLFLLFSWFLDYHNFLSCTELVCAATTQAPVSLPPPPAPGEPWSQSPWRWWQPC